jgi:hypothetical protein
MDAVISRHVPHRHGYISVITMTMSPGAQSTKEQIPLASGTAAGTERLPGYASERGCLSRPFPSYAVSSTASTYGCSFFRTYRIRFRSFLAIRTIA